ncbi:hypothetical protein C0J52_08300 [Blattella germanica]|nr:hypothetical protein C0J52_08300 [Blattella germanica]
MDSYFKNHMVRMSFSRIETCQQPPPPIININEFKQWLVHVVAKLTKSAVQSVEDEHRSGRPSTSRPITPDNIERVLQMIVDDRQMSLRMIADEMIIGNLIADVADIKQRNTIMLREIPKEAFSDSFQQIYNR